MSEVVEMRQLDAFRLRREAMEHVHGILSATGYRSAAGDVSALRLKDMFLGHRLDAVAVQYDKHQGRASIRDLGGLRHSEREKLLLASVRTPQNQEMFVVCSELNVVCCRFTDCCLVMSSFFSTRQLQESSSIISVRFPQSLVTKRTSEGWIRSEKSFVLFVAVVLFSVFSLFEAHSSYWSISCLRSVSMCAISAL